MTWRRAARTLEVRARRGLRRWLTRPITLAPRAGGALSSAFGYGTLYFSRPARRRRSGTRSGEAARRSNPGGARASRVAPLADPPHELGRARDAAPGVTGFVVLS